MTMEDVQNNIDHANDLNSILLKQAMESCPEVVLEVLVNFNNNSELLSISEEEFNSYLK